VSNVASKLDQFENERGQSAPGIPTPSRRSDDFADFGSSLSDPEPQPYVSPMDAARPLRAAPLAPLSPMSDLPASPPLGPHEASNGHDVYFAEEIDDLLVDETSEGEEAPAPEFKSIHVSPDDDLLIDELAMDEIDAVAPPPVDDDPFWTPEEPDPTAAGELAASADDAGPILDEDPPGAAASPAPGKNDYLANARRAAQAQSLPKTRNEPSPTPRLSLRGSSRIILWTSATAIAALLIGGAWYLNRDNGAPAEPQQLPENLASPSPQGQAADPNAAPLEAPADPFAQAPAGVDPATGAGASPATTAAPVAQQAAPAQQQAAVVAGPLQPRNVSLEQAAQAGDLTAQYELALQRIGAGRTQEGIALLRRAADRGFPMAQYRMAKLYERGEGVQADLTVARQWTERAAAAGNRRAMHDLGVYFARGEGAPLDEAAAFRWFRQAAELGVADSQYNLGVLYQQGRGVNASASEALFWFMVAARQGDEDAGARATALEPQLSQIQVQQARARAQAFRPRAASAVANGEFGSRPWARAGT
jgi:TPR repeat protein